MKRELILTSPRCSVQCRPLVSVQNIQIYPVIVEEAYNGFLTEVCGCRQGAPTRPTYRIMRIKTEQ